MKSDAEYHQFCFNRFATFLLTHGQKNKNDDSWQKIELCHGGSWLSWHWKISYKIVPVRNEQMHDPRYILRSQKIIKLFRFVCVTEEFFKQILKVKTIDL